MVQMQIAISDKHYQYLQQRARTKSASVEQILSELIEANLAWQQKLAADPVRQLFAQLEDSFDTHDIDQVVYNLEA